MCSSIYTFAKKLAFGTCYQYITSDQDIDANIIVMKDLYVDSIKELSPHAPKPRELIEYRIVTRNTSSE